jgi:hypothetical protein
MDSSRRPFVAIVDVPMHISSDKIEVKEIIKRWDAMDVVMEIAKVALKRAEIVTNSDRTLAELRRPAWNNRRCCPCLKGSEVVLESLRPVGVEQIVTIRSGHA